MSLQEKMDTLIDYVEGRQYLFEGSNLSFVITEILKQLEDIKVIAIMLQTLVEGKK